jgi:hypothetical protein
MRGKKPTRNQRQIIEQNKLDTYKWLVQKDTADKLYVVHAETQEEKVLVKAK